MAKCTSIARVRRARSDIGAVSLSREHPRSSYQMQRFQGGPGAPHPHRAGITPSMHHRKRPESPNNLRSCRSFRACDGAFKPWDWRSLFRAGAKEDGVGVGFSNCWTWSLGSSVHGLTIADTHVSAKSTLPYTPSSIVTRITKPSFQGGIHHRRYMPW